MCSGWRVATMLAQIVFLLIPTPHSDESPAWLNTSYASMADSESDGACSGGGRSVFSSAIMEGYLFFQDKIPLPESIRPFLEAVRKLIEETYAMLVQAHSPSELLLSLLLSH